MDASLKVMGGLMMLKWSFDRGAHGRRGNGGGGGEQGYALDGFQGAHNATSSDDIAEMS